MTTLGDDPVEDLLDEEDVDETADEATDVDDPAADVDDPPTDADDPPTDADGGDTLVDVPDSAIVADAVELDEADDVDLLTDGPYAHGEEDRLEVEVDDDTDAAAPVVPPVTERPTRRQHRAEMKASARRVRRVVRHVDPWSVFKVASLFIACAWSVVVLASLLIWRVAVESGSVDDTESFIVELGFQDFDFNPEQMFESLLSLGAILAIAAIFFTVLLTVLFNLICDLTGGVRITMLEQDVADARKRTRRRDGDVV